MISKYLMQREKTFYYTEDNMKKITFVILTSVLAFIIINCSNESEKNNKLNEPQTDIYETDTLVLQPKKNDEDLNNVSFRLAYKFEQGESFKYKLTTLSTTERDVQTDTVLIDRYTQKITRIMNFKIISVDKDSIAEIECNISSVNVDVDLNNQKISYQSEVTTNSEQLKKFIEHEGIVNNPFHFLITKYGEIIDIFKFEEISDRYLDLSGLKDSINTEDKVLMQIEIKNNLLKPLIGQVLREFPMQDLRIESTWEKTMDPATIMVFKIHYTDHFTVNKLELVNNDRIAHINGKATTVIEGEKEHTNNGIKYEFIEPLSEANGEIYFNIDRGLVNKSNSTTNLKLSYRMEIPSADGTKIGKANEFITNANILELL